MKIRICFAFILAIYICTSVFADGMYIPQIDPIDPSSRYQDIKEPTQKAIIVFADKKERLILQTTYTGKVSNFVWVVPTPNIVKVDKAESNVFEIFHMITAPRLKYWFNANEWEHFGAAARSAQSAAVPDVDVLGEKKIGVFDVIVLRARKADELIKWLNTNKYQIPKNIKPILDDYIKRGWVFTISKVSATSFKDKNKKMSGTLEPLVFEFNTEKPVYPLKLTSLNKGKTKILIYTIAKNRMDCKGFETLYSSNNSDSSKYNNYFRRGAYVAFEGFKPFENMYLEQNNWISKLSAELYSKDMKEDLILKNSKANEVVYPKDRYVPIYDNIAVILKGAIIIPLVLYSTFPLISIILAVCIIAFVIIKMKKVKHKFRLVFFTVFLVYFASVLVYLILLVSLNFYDWIIQPASIFIAFGAAITAALTSYLIKKSKFKLFILTMLILILLLIGLNYYVNH